MLELLRIRHLALIDDAELEFSPGMNVLTGETGAGKSFILKALNFLTGDRMSPDLVRPGAEKAQVEALFALPNEDIVIRRELTAATGRSRLYINDALSSQDSIRDLRPALLVHTSQHGQQKLLQPAFQGKILDDFLNRPDLIQQRDSLLRELRALDAQHAELRERSRSLEDRRELLEFQQREIAKVAPEHGEEETLEAKKRELRNQTVVQETIDTALSLLGAGENGILDGMGRLERALEALRRVMPDYEDDVTLLVESRQNLHDLASRLRRQPLNGDGEDRLEDIESRLYALAQLKRKLKRSLDEIVDLQQEIEENLSFLDSCALDAKQLDKRRYDLLQSLSRTVAELNPLRREAGDQLCSVLETELRGLGFSEHVRVRFAFQPVDLYPCGPDKPDGPDKPGEPSEPGEPGGTGRPGKTSLPPCVEDRPHLMWIPNPGQPAQPLDKIASGGELSRFLLAVVGIMNRKETPSLIFDEVDSGVGGLTLNHVADALGRLAAHQQVILITHWPQLAARAARHFHVRKEVREGSTFTLCQTLDAAAIREELARMAGGGEQGAAMARELLHA